MKDYYKKVDKSLFKDGFTLPQEMIESFCFGEPLAVGSRRPVSLVWGQQRYEAKLVHTKSGNRTVYQMRWDANRALNTALKKEFIQSYVAIESQKYDYTSENKYHITKLLGGSQEVLIFKPVDKQTVKLETFIKIQTPYDSFFKRMVDENVFGWLSAIEKKDDVIQKQTRWHGISDLRKHQDAQFVIYYLLDEAAKQLYIGSATTLGSRVKPNRREIPGWNKFRYDIIRPEYHGKLRVMEYYAIMSYARLFNNAGGLTTLGICDYTLVNRDYKFYM